MLRLLFSVAAGLLQCSCWAVGWSSYAKHHSVYGTVGLTSPADAFPALKRRDLTEARRILEAKLQTRSNDPEVSYTLGCVDLMQSDEIIDGKRKRALQAQGWQRVESASGKFYPADQLLAHAYLVGRWGKTRNGDLYEKHLRLASDGFKSQNGKAGGAGLLERTWRVLSPP